MRYSEKGAREISKWAQLPIFHSKFSKCRAFGMLHPPIGNVVLKFFTESKYFIWLKSNHLKEALNFPKLQVKFKLHSFVNFGGCIVTLF